MVIVLIEPGTLRAIRETPEMKGVQTICFDIMGRPKMTQVYIYICMSLYEYILLNSHWSIDQV